VLIGANRGRLGVGGELAARYDQTPARPWRSLKEAGGSVRRETTAVHHEN
jgi:hypothetical protein